MIDEIELCKREIAQLETQIKYWRDRMSANQNALAPQPVLQEVTCKEHPELTDYLIYSDGRVYSKKTNKFKAPGFSGPTSNKKMYLHYTFRLKGRVVGRAAHRLVMEAFVGPRPPGLVCAHLDGNPRNNNLSNLKWVSYSENAFHNGLHLRTRRHTWRAKLTRLQVDMIRGPEKEIKDSVLAKKYGVSRSAINQAKRGTTWKA